ncbi:hypothetical protein AVEN_260271-1 [Araneus ventricosus]|uniref:DDE Tnp4 domain-containing protein n=1 Tax=Araneus ventricosus TaxID=182803 RepID=A0A4Y2FP50_ARAVE|nr:hypothetical protein AVEN_260271-1 [Araneus ventricosus]
MQLAIADLFEVSQPTVSRVVHRGYSITLARLHLPASQQGGMQRVSPGGEDAERFRCRKNDSALNVQTIVDSDLVIRNVVARWPGRTHDSTIFINSAACLTLQSNSLFRNYHLLGDSGYGLEKYLSTPLGNPRSPAEVRYSKSHVLTRNTVERKYGILKKRFLCLSIGLNCHIERVPAIIVACCVLRNLAIRLDPQIQDLLRQLELETEQLQLTPSIGAQPRCPAGFCQTKCHCNKLFF